MNTIAYSQSDAGVTVVVIRRFHRQLGAQVDYPGAQAASAGISASQAHPCRSDLAPDRASFYLHPPQADALKDACVRLSTRGHMDTNFAKPQPDASAGVIPRVPSFCHRGLPTTWSLDCRRGLGQRPHAVTCYFKKNDNCYPCHGLSCKKHDRRPAVLQGRNIDLGMPRRQVCMETIWGRAKRAVSVTSRRPEPCHRGLV